MNMHDMMEKKVQAWKDEFESRCSFPGSDKSLATTLLNIRLEARLTLILEILEEGYPKALKHSLRVIGY